MLLATTLLIAAVGAPPDPAADVSTALARWHKNYVAGKIELREVAQRGGKSNGIYNGLLPERRFNMTHFDGLQELFGLAVEHQSVEVMRATVRLAAVGHGTRIIDFARRPDVVRSAAISTLGQFTRTRTLHALMQTAGGSADGWRNSEWNPSLQAAALRALGAADIAVARPLIQKQVKSEHSDVRLAAGAALEAMGRPRSLRTIAAAIHAERHGRVAEQLVSATDAILSRNADRCSTELIRDSVRATCGIIGRTDWRADLAAVKLLGKFRNVAAIEPLVRILERFHDPEIDPRLTSGILRHHTHLALQSLTGARIPASQPEQWREFWNKVRDGFVLAKQPEPKAGKTTAGFFGIPILGTRVVFVIDRSGSMMQPYGAPQGKRLTTRFDYARDELLRAVSQLPEDTQFNVVTFSDSVKKWRKAFVPPTPANQATLKTKLRATRVNGSTNIYGALDKALSMRTAAYGQRYEVFADEIFLLSDGAPTVGDIIDTEGILDVVSGVNDYRKVRINTVFIGPETESAFMRELAKRNDGEFVRL